MDRTGPAVGSQPASRLLLVHTEPRWTTEEDLLWGVSAARKEPSAPTWTLVLFKDRQSWIV